MPTKKYHFQNKPFVNGEFINSGSKLKIDKISIPSVEDILNIRLNKWASNLLNSPIRKDLNGKLLTDIQMLLGSLSYEELVEKLVSKEIDALNYNKKSKDLNKSERGSKRSSRAYSERRSRGRDKKLDKRDLSKSDFKRNEKTLKVSKVLFFCQRDP